MGSELTRRIVKLERVMDGGPDGETAIAVLDTPEERAKYGIEHGDAWVAPFRVTLAKEEARERGARRAWIIFMTEAEWRL